MNLAIVGATGLVGRTFLQIIEERNIEFDQLYLYASAKSAGQTMEFKGETYTILEAAEKNILDKTIDVALFSAGGETSKNIAPLFVAIGALVIDNSSAFRMTEHVPLVVPEVNKKDIFTHHGIIANPNCSTIQSVVVLAVIDKLFSIKRVDYTTYQAVSGSGQKGIDDYHRTARGEQPAFYPYPIFDNVIPQIDCFLDTNFTYEEQKMIQETQKILHLPDLPVSATCVRVPVQHAHSVSMIVETNDDIDLILLQETFKNTEGIVYLDDPKHQSYPMPYHAAHQDPVYVGRLRQDIYDDHKLHVFCSADNIRKGAALNAIQILEEYWKGRD